MNRQVDHHGLIEPFPTRCEYSDLSLSSVFSNLSNSMLPISNSLPFHRNTSVLNSSISTLDTDLRDSFSSLSSDATTKVPVSSAIDDDDFRRLQEDLRASRVWTGMGTKQVLSDFMTHRTQPLKQSPRIALSVLEDDVNASSLRGMRRSVSARLSRRLGTTLRVKKSKDDISCRDRNSKRTLKKKKKQRK